MADTLTENTPTIVVIAGPNGAGKSTTAPVLLDELLGLREFVNADAIAQGLSAYAPEEVALQAGRVMLSRLRQLAKARKSFAFETTLASRSFAPWLRKQKAAGYTVCMLFLYLPSPEFALGRVAERVRSGGHHVPEKLVRRRYEAGLENFFRLYQPLLDTWWFYGTTQAGEPQMIAASRLGELDTIQSALWQGIEERYGNR